MIINGSKTKALCISDAKSYRTEAYMIDKYGVRIDEVKQLNILGFTFSNKPNMNLKVESMKRSIRSRLWMLTHLGHNGFTKEELLKLMGNNILPIHAYLVYQYSITAS